MSQHISIRVPWHDHDWDGTVCADPTSNNACLRLPNIAKNRDDKAEIAICGQCIAGIHCEICEDLGNSGKIKKLLGSFGKTNFTKKFFIEGLYIH